MNEWREAALQMLPELQSEIKKAETPMDLWVEIVFHFDEAYDEPRKDDFIRRVYAYADWSLSQDIGETAEEHLPTCVAVCFWEHIPTFAPARDDMPRWFSFEEVIGNEHWFRYSLTEEEYEELKGLYSEAEDSQ